VILLCLPPLNQAEDKPSFSGEEVTYTRKARALKGYLSKPAGPGPFPAVIYNHGGLGDRIGGCPKETSEALAKASYVGFSPLRRQTISMQGHMEDVLDALEYVKGLDYVDKDRIAMMGFSRGGHLTFIAGAAQKDLKAIVIMACAPGMGDREQFLLHAKEISAPVLLMVSENDQAQADHVALMKQIKNSLEKENKQVEFILYPPYKNDGHRMFFEISSYWKAVLKVLNTNLNKQ